MFSVFSKSNQPAFFTEDNRLPPAMGAFSWPPMWMSQAPGTGGVLSGTALKGYLNDFEQKAASWPTYISSAFPRFHDIYQRAGMRNYWGYLGDRQGETLRETLSRGMTNSSALVQIVTWNDFGEGSIIEPTREYGFRDLGIIQDLRRQYWQADFSGHTNDLAMVYELFNLRRNASDKAPISAALDGIFQNIVNNETTAARQSLDRLRAQVSR